jgi:hypothetical protein
MFGPWGAGIGGLAGGLLGLFGGGNDPVQTPYNINPYTDQMMQKLQGLSTQYENRSQDMWGKASNYFDKMGNFQPNATYDPSAYTQDFATQVGSLEQIAKRNINPFGDAEASAQRVSDEARRQASGMFAGAGLNSGAAAAAIGGAAGNARADYENAMNAQYQGMLSPMLNQAMGNSLQSRLAEYQGSQNADQMRFAGLQGAAGGYGSYAQSLQNALSNLYGQQTALSGQEFYAPPADTSGSDMLAALGQWGNLGLNVASNPELMAMMPWNQPKSVVPGSGGFVTPLGLR